MYEQLGHQAQTALESGDMVKIISALKSLRQRGCAAEVLGIFDSLTGNLITSQNGFVRDPIVLCLTTHANKNTEILNRAITWADTALSAPRESVSDHIQGAEAAHLIGYLKDLKNRGSDFHNLGNKLLELAKDSNEHVEVRTRCVQALGRIDYTEALGGLKGLTSESLDNEEFLLQLGLAIAALRQSVQERCN